MKYKKDFALVLSGGGAKGAYQIGAWKALNNEGFNFSAVSGASVGSLNAALVAQGDIERGDHLWEEIEIKNVVDVPSDLISNGKITLNTKSLKSLTGTWQKGLLLDSSPLKKLIKKEVDEKLIRKKGVDLGVVTINRSSFKTVEIFLDQIEEGLLADYLYASASYPAFKNAEIKGEKYIDGGLHDNIPSAMLKNRGYRKIIIIDISGPGHNRKPDIVGTDTIYIKNSIELPGVLDFSRESLRKSSLLGYLDTEKILGGNEGRKYFFRPDFNIVKKLEHILKTKELQDYIKIYSDSSKETLTRILPDEYKHWKYPVFSLMECAALSLGIERIASYDLNDLIELIWVKFREIDSEFFVNDLNMSFFDELERVIKEIKSVKSISDYPPYTYYKGAVVISGTEKPTIEKNALFVFYPFLKGSIIFRKLLSKYFMEEESK